MELESIQGGVFSENGNFYLINGYCADFDVYKGGIWVFDARDGENGYLFDRSTNGYGHFNFDWEVDCDEYCLCDEPEGITIWDLDNGDAPGISGQIHVLMIDNDAGWDDLYFRHYSTSSRDQCKI